MEGKALWIILLIVCAVQADSAIASAPAVEELTGYDPDPVPLNNCLNNCSFIGECYKVYQSETGPCTPREHMQDPGITIPPQYACTSAPLSLSLFCRFPGATNFVCSCNFPSKSGDCSDYSLFRYVEALSWVEITVIVLICVIVLAVIAVCVWRKCCDRTRGFQVVSVDERGLPKNRSFIISPFSKATEDEPQDEVEMMQHHDSASSSRGEYIPSSSGRSAGRGGVYAVDVRDGA